MVAPVQLRLLPNGCSIDADGHLALHGVTVEELAHEFGTPLFVYDEDQLRDGCREAVDAFGSGVAYASKAFLCKAMAHLVVEEGMNIDVSTLGELHVAMSAGVSASRLVMHGNNKSDLELKTALEVGVGRLVVDSFDEIHRLEGLLAASRRALLQDVLIRVTPGIEAHTHEFIMTGQDDSKFGFNVANGDAQRAIQAVRRLSGLNLVGLHAHIGSQVFEAASFAMAVEVLAKIFNPLALSELCVGGGLGVSYLPDEEAPSISQWAKAVKDAALSAGVGPEVTITAEPGRSIVASAAMTAYTVGTVKQIPGIRNYVSVDGGMSDNPRPVLYGSGYEAFLSRKALDERTYPCRIVGKHCESGDVLVRDAFLPDDVKVGDVLVTPVTGAYGYSMSSSYNRMLRPAVVFVSNKGPRLVLRRETLDDLLHLEV